jgi:hypothetical protein
MMLSTLQDTVKDSLAVDITSDESQPLSQLEHIEFDYSLQSIPKAKRGTRMKESNQYLRLFATFRVFLQDGTVQEIADVEL